MGGRSQTTGSNLKAQGLWARTSQKPKTQKLEQVPNKNQSCSFITSIGCSGGQRAQREPATWACSPESQLHLGLGKGGDCPKCPVSSSVEKVGRTCFVCLKKV